MTGLTKDSEADVLSWVQIFKEQDSDLKDGDLKPQERAKKAYLVCPGLNKGGSG